MASSSSSSVVKRKRGDDVDVVATAAARKRSKFKPMSAEELKQHTSADGVFEINQTTLQGKAGLLRRFAETVRRDPKNVGSSFLTDKGEIKMRKMGSNAIFHTNVYSKSLGTQQRKGRDYEALDNQIGQLLRYMHSCGYNACQPAFVQSFGYGKWSRKSPALKDLAAQAARDHGVLQTPLQALSADAMNDE